MAIQRLRIMPAPPVLPESEKTIDKEEKEFLSQDRDV
jgi:hypothetical protein